MHHIPSLALLLFKPYDAVHDTSFATATTAGEDAESIHRSPQDESAGGGLPRGPDPTLVVEPKRSFALEWELRKKPRRSNSLDPNFAPGQAFVIAELPTTAPTAPRKGAPTMPVLLAEWRARRGQVPAALQCTRNVPPVDRIQPLFTDIAFIPKQHLLRRALSESDIQSAKPPFNGHIGRLDSPDVTHAEMAVRLRGFHHSTLRYFLERPTTLCTMYTRTAQWLAQSEEKNTELQIQCDSLRQKCYSQKRFTAKQPIWILVRVRKVLEDTDEAASSLLTDFQYRSTQDKVSLSCLAPPGTTPAVSSAPTVFEIDHYFGSSSTNREVYREVEPLMDIVFHGNDVCIFADGQSGSGKSWTMFKGANALAPSIAESIMTWKDTDAVEGWKREVQCSAIEVHMDKLKDLLAPKGTEHFDIAKAKRGLYDRPAVCVEALLDLFKRAHSRLEVKGTHENRESSRGHFICSLVLTQSHPERPSVKSRITMIDLAGSERTVHPSRIAETHNRSSTAESVFINSSRTALRVFLKAHRNLGLGSVVSEVREPPPTHIRAPADGSPVYQIPEDYPDK